MESLQMKKLGFGAMRLPVLEDGTSIDQPQVNQMIDHCMAEGFTYFDTAYPYHGGKSEGAMKTGLVQRYPRSQYLLADKMPMYLVEKEEDYPRFFAEQLERCGVEYFDFYLLHNLGVENYRKAERTHGFAYLQQLKKAGKAHFVGFSFHDTADVLEHILTQHPEVDFVQLQINYADWDRPSVQSGACYQVARKHGKQIVIMEPIKGGGLANPVEKIHTLFHEYNPKASAASWAIRFAASLEGVLTVLSGMSKLEHALDNCAYMKEFQPLNAAEKQIIQQAVEIIEQSTAIPCTACQYCVEHCPMRINIPSLFSIYNMVEQFGSANFPAMHYARQTLDRGKASDCIACGACETHCPQHIPIIEDMKRVATRFEK
jgi:hypothetical protein